jgi:hypothetical protein
MAAIIRFTDSAGLEEGIKIFRRFGDAVPAGMPDTYYVSDHIVALLKSHHVLFEQIEPDHYGLLRVTEAMFDDLRKAVAESHQGNLIRVSDPQSLDDIIHAEMNKQ